MFVFAETKSVSTPFGSVVGQSELKEALLAVAVDDGLDGLLVTGEKGTAKSTLVRGLADLLGEQRVVADCPYGCPPADRRRQCEECRSRATLPVCRRSVPLVTLPLGATRDRLLGTLSVADALSGEAEFDPGVLARANRGLLYVDEINLLDDHLVDALLDAAASGRNRVERDGVSVTHPAVFTLIGTMNPEEGQLRPQLRDRFGLSVEVTAEDDLDDRVAIIDGALGGSDRGDDTDTDACRRRLRRARNSLEDVELTEEGKRSIAELCRDAGVDGHRGDIAAARAARALAALEGRPTVTDSDLRRAAELALGHRMRSGPFEDAPDVSEAIDDHFDDAGDERADADAGESGDGGQSSDDTESTAEGRDSPEDGSQTEGGDREDPERSETETDAGDTEPKASPEGRSAVVETGEDTDGSGSDEDEPDAEATPLVPGQPRQPPGKAAAPAVDTPDSETANGTGSAGAAPAADNHHARVRTEAARNGESVDAAASIRAAASRGGDRIERRDLRRSVRTGAGEALVVFAVDASASMRPAMRAAKACVLELLEDAYTERDAVSVVAFAGEDAEVLLPPTDSVTLAARHLKELPTGARTPLPAGIRTAAEVVERASPDVAVVVLVSDGRANVADRPTADTRAAADTLASTDAGVVCVDAGDDDGLLDDVVAATDGDRVPLDALTAGRIEAAVGDARGRGR